MKSFNGLSSSLPKNQPSAYPAQYWKVIGIIYKNSRTSFAIVVTVESHLITNKEDVCCLGFLSMEDSRAPGNYAIFDLVAALHWVKENIAAFGGDSNQVALLGHGYGAALVNILLVSPITKGD